MDANTTTLTTSVEGVAVSAFGEHGEAFIVERVAEFTARGDGAAVAMEDAAYWADCGEGELSTWYCEVARRLQPAVSAFDVREEEFIAALVATYTKHGWTAADAQAAADEHAAHGEHYLARLLSEVARRLEDADLVTVDAGSDAPMQVVREGVSLDGDEAQWRVDNAVGLELGRRPLTVDPAAVETQAQFDARMARGYAEREARRPVADPFRRLPVHEDVAF